MIAEKRLKLFQNRHPHHLTSCDEGMVKGTVVVWGDMKGITLITLNPPRFVSEGGVKLK